MRWMRFQPPGPGLAPSGMGRPAELAGPLSSSRRLPRVTSAKAGAALVRTSKPRCFGVEVDRRRRRRRPCSGRSPSRLVRSWVPPVLLSGRGRRGGEGGEQEPDAGLQLGGGLLEGRVAGLVVAAAWPAAGSGMLQWMVSGWPGNSGQTSRTRSHRLITRSKRWSANTLEVLRALTGQVDAVLVPHHPHRVGVQRLGVAAGAVGLDQPTGASPGQRLGHLRAGAVAGAQEQHPRPSPAPARSLGGGGVRRRPGCRAPPVADSSSPTRARSTV